MVDWDQAVMVALSGLISVFLVLTTLSISVTITGNIIEYFDKRKKAQHSNAMPG